MVDNSNFFTTIQVENDSGLALHLHHAYIPVDDSITADLAIEALAIDGVTPVVRDVSGGSMAAIPLDHSLPGGDSWSFRIRIEVTADPCSLIGSHTVQGFPIVEVSYLGQYLSVMSSSTLEITRGYEQERKRRKQCRR